jgi:cobalt-zinc-cadmium efflux system outer membrane protein
MTLDQLQQMALTNNPTLRQAKAGVTAAEGLTRQAGLWPNPTVGYVGE